MAQYIATDIELTSIANAIRNITQSNEKLAFPNGFTNAIDEIGEQIANTPIPEEPDVYAKYTRDSGNHITAIKFHGFKEIPAGGEGTRTAPNKFFDKNNYLQTIDFSESPELKIIERYAFNWCQNLTSIEFPDNEHSNLKTIEERAFIQCNALANTLLPNSITDIGLGAFSACSNLALTKLPDNLVNLEESAFYNCKHLNITTVPSGVTELKDWTFYMCGHVDSNTGIGTGLEHFIIPATVKKLGNQVFNTCANLKTVIFEGTPESIGSYVFGYCKNLTDIYVPWSEGTFTAIEEEWKDKDVTHTTNSVTIHYNYTE